MSRKGDYWENALTESFFHILNMEDSRSTFTIPVRKQKQLFLSISKIL